MAATAAVTRMAKSMLSQKLDRPIFMTTMAAV